MEDEDLVKWDYRFLDLASLVASWSKDTSTKVGCVIVGPDREIRSTGYNGFPRGVNDQVEERFQRPLKYVWTEHAERNAIFNAVRSGISLKGCTVYMHWCPCADCCRAIIQSGITTVVVSEPDLDDPRWGESQRIALEMIKEAGLCFRFRDTKPIKTGE